MAVISAAIYMQVQMSANGWESVLPLLEQVEYNTVTEIYIVNELLDFSHDGQCWRYEAEKQLKKCPISCIPVVYKPHQRK